MKSFSYLQPKTLKEADKLLRDKPNAIIYAGGTDVLDLLKHNITSPDNLINLKSIPELDKITTDADKGISIGALVKVADIAADKMIIEKYPVLAQAAKEVASPQLRNMGTIGGNLCQRPRCWYFREDFDCVRKGGDVCYAYAGENKYHCIVGGSSCFIVHPSDIAVALLALNAKLTIQSGKKKRTIPISEFYILPEIDSTKENILLQGEIITDILIPPLKVNTRSGYLKFKERGAWDFAVVSVGVVVTYDGNKIEDARIAFGGMAPKPWMDQEFNTRLKGLSSISEIESVVKELFKDVKPLDKNEYKIPLVRNLTMDLLEKLLG